MTFKSFFNASGGSDLSLQRHVAIDDILLLSGDIRDQVANLSNNAVHKPTDGQKQTKTDTYSLLSGSNLVSGGVRYRDLTTDYKRECNVCTHSLLASGVNNHVRCRVASTVKIKSNH